MKINTVDTTFQSRNSTIRFADDIARRVNQCYPRKSASLITSMKNIDRFKSLETRLSEGIAQMRQTKRDRLFAAKTFPDMLRAIVDTIKESKTGNCGESAELSAIVAKANGIQNCYLAEVEGEYGNDLDHTVLYVNDKIPYVIDSWLGFADYVPNAVARYKNEYLKYFDEYYMNQKIVFTKKDMGVDYFLNYKFSDFAVKSLREQFPETVIRKSS